MTTRPKATTSPDLLHYAALRAAITHLSDQHCYEQDQVIAQEEAAYLAHLRSITRARDLRLDFHAEEASDEILARKHAARNQIQAVRKLELAILNALDTLFFS